MTGETVEADAEMRIVCEGVGELVLWVSAIDTQLTKALIRACSLTETPMIEIVINELGTRTKIEILRARAKLIEAPVWPENIIKWLGKVDEVNRYRNVAAHQQVVFSDEKLIFRSEQAGKLLRSIKNLEQTPANSVDDINQWVEAAKNAYVQGQNVLSNLDRFADEVAKCQSKLNHWWRSDT